MVSEGPERGGVRACVHRTVVVVGGGGKASGSAGVCLGLRQKREWHSPLAQHGQRRCRGRAGTISLMREDVHRLVNACAPMQGVFIPLRVTDAG